MKDYIFMKRKHQISVWWLVLVVVFCLLYAGYSERKDIIQRQQIQKWKDNADRNIMVWEMNQSCAKQFQNNMDGILRIKLSK